MRTIARITSDEFVQFYRRERASAILRTRSEEAAGPAMEAAVRAGFRVIEFTLTVPRALDRIAEFSRRDGLVVGAGTVLTVEEARASVEAGAGFLVSPVTDEAVVEEARRLGVAMLPGAFTPTEMLRAHRAGATLVKLFPGPGTGPDYLRAVLGPLPFLRVVPTNGVDRANVSEWLAAGAVAVGFTNALFDSGELNAGRFDRVEERGRALRAALPAVAAAPAVSR
jgi:2-dehydro-3-deoxyphosphogluconate aldolase/(4S)-4-hydroxy-2-oxoglutarate aldolase